MNEFKKCFNKTIERVYTRVFSALMLLLIFLYTSACSCDGWAGRSSNPFLKTNLPGNQMIFTSVDFKKKQVREFLIYNTGVRSLSIDRITLDERARKAYRLVKTSIPLPTNLETGKERGLKVTIEILLHQSGVFHGLLKVYTKNAQNRTLKNNFNIKLSHQALESKLQWMCSSSIRFGKTKQGSEKKRSCILRNNGNSSVQIFGSKYIRHTGSPQEFRWVKPTFEQPLTLNPDQEIEVTIAYKPLDPIPSKDSGFFVLQTTSNQKKNAQTSNAVSHALKLEVSGETMKILLQLIEVDRSCSPIAVCLEGFQCVKVSDENLSFCIADEFKNAALFDFEKLEVGYSSSRKVMLRAIGDFDLVIKKIDLQGSGLEDFIVTPSKLKLPLRLKPGESKLLRIKYTPLKASPSKAVLSIQSNASNISDAKILLQARSQECWLHLTPSPSIMFIGSKQISLRILNRGKEECILTKLQLEKPDQAFLLRLPSKNSWNFRLAPRKSIEVQIGFDETKALKENNKLFVEAEGTLHTVKLFGLPSSTQGCILFYEENQVKFGAIQVQKNQNRRILLRNLGSKPCYVERLSIINKAGQHSPSAFTWLNSQTSHFKINPFESKILSLSFQPVQIGFFYAKVLFREKNKSNLTYQIKLSGEGVEPCLQVFPKALDFGSVKKNCASSGDTVEVFNTGGKHCTQIEVKSVKIIQNPKSAFRLKGSINLPKTLPGRKSLKLAIDYKANQLGRQRAWLEIETKNHSLLRIPLVGEGSDSLQQSEHFKQSLQPFSDILFVIDNSCSMGDDQRALSSNLSRFIDQSKKYNAEFHIGVATTDSFGCLVGNPKVLTPRSPNLLHSFKRNVLVGTGGSDTEKGLESSYRTLLASQKNVPNCASGFYRPGAALHIIFISDEGDQSLKALDFYRKFFQTLKGSESKDLIRLSAVVDFAQNDSSDRYWRLAGEFKGIQETLPTIDWGKKLQNIGNISFRLRRVFTIKGVPEANSLVIKVDGKIIPNDGKHWSYDAQKREILFSLNQAPPPQANIEIEYKMQCLP